MVDSSHSSQIDFYTVLPQLLLFSPVLSTLPRMLRMHSSLYNVILPYGFLSFKINTDLGVFHLTRNLCDLSNKLIMSNSHPGMILTISFIASSCTSSSPRILLLFMFTTVIHNSSKKKRFHVRNYFSSVSPSLTWEKSSHTISWWLP